MWSKKVFTYFMIIFGALIVLTKSATVPQTKSCYFPLSIIHINDFHARFDQINPFLSSCKEKLGQVCIGGYARTLTVVKKLMKEKAEDNPIYLNIGDNFQGTLWYSLLGWNVTSTFMNYLPADAITLGNHEFDRGIKGVVPFMETLKSPIVVANINDTDEPTFQGKYKKSIVIERSGRKIGLIGAVTVDTKTMSSPGKLIFLDPTESIKKEADRLKIEEDVDIIVVLSHCGLDEDRLIAANGGENIDVIVGGHSHNLLYSGSPVPGPDKPADIYPILVNQSDNHKVLIVQASAYTKYVGDLTVYFDDNGELQKWEGNPIFLDHNIVEDPEIKEKLIPWKEEVEKISKQELGILEKLVSNKECRYAECTLGNMVTDAYMDYFANHKTFKEEGSWNYINAALHQSGAMRTDLNNGSVSYDDLSTALPFQDTVDNSELQGKDLLELLEYSISTHKKFVQMSGLKVIFDKRLPINSRVVSAEILCRKCGIPTYQPVNPEEWYRLATPSYITLGGDGFYMLKNNRNYHVGDKIEVAVIGNYLAKKSPLLVEIDGRIKILN